MKIENGKAELMDTESFWRPMRMPGSDAKAKLFLKNQTGRRLELCCGEREYSLGQNEVVEIEIQDGDCMYLDWFGPISLK